MQVNVGPCAGDGQTGGSTRASNLFAQIGWKGLFLVVWRSTPFPLRLIAFPYGVLVYRSLLAATENPDFLYTLHVEKYQSSCVFKVLRPRYRTVVEVLRTLLAADGKPRAV